MILDGIKHFAKTFEGNIVSETMLIDNVKYNSEFERIAEFLGGLNKLDKAYIAIPTRPPTEEWVKPAKEEDINAAFQMFSEKLGSGRVEYLIAYEGNAFAFTGNVKEDLLSIMAVHPMREAAIIEFLRKTNADWHLIEQLLKENKLKELDYEGNIFYMRKLPNKT
jgi:wyosine [tRNA(Phe)-imidazoG37] synthetase (radical SAM superfamily)